MIRETQFKRYFDNLAYLKFSLRKGKKATMPKKLIEEAFTNARVHKVSLQKNKDKSAVKNTGAIQKTGKVMPHIMFALSWMIPLVVASGLTMAIGNVFSMQKGWMINIDLNWKGVVLPTDPTAGIWIKAGIPAAIQHQLESGGWFKVAHIWNYVTFIDKSGNIMTNIQQYFQWGQVRSFYNREIAEVLFNSGIAGLGLIYPVIAAALAYSIAGKLAFPAAFLGGWLMNDGNFINLSINGHAMGTGFIGALAVGFIIGYLILLLRKVPVNKNLKGVVNLMVCIEY